MGNAGETTGKSSRQKFGTYMLSRFCDPLLHVDSKAYSSCFNAANTEDCNKMTSLVSSVNGQLLKYPVETAKESNDLSKRVLNPRDSCHVVAQDGTLSIAIEVEGVKRLIGSLKAGKALGPCSIGNRFLTMALDYVAGILTKIIQYSVDSSVLPSVWKLAKGALFPRVGPVRATITSFPDLQLL